MEFYTLKYVFVINATCGYQIKFITLYNKLSSLSVTFMLFHMHRHILS
jgi:hypothetical protein